MIKVAVELAVEVAELELAIEVVDELELAGLALSRPLLTFFFREKVASFGVISLILQLLLPCPGNKNLPELFAVAKAPALP